jgi:O-succinylbenzoic acid--CoA ligase
VTRPLLAVDARDPGAVHDALRVALEGGPAVAPRTDDRVPVDLPGVVPQAVSLVVETSGSSGRPKRVALSSDAVLAGAAAADGALAGPGQWVLALPAHYVAGLNVLVRSLAAGTEPALLAPGHFDVGAFAAAAERLDHPVRYSSLVPAQLSTALDGAEADPAVADVMRRSTPCWSVGRRPPPPSSSGPAASASPSCAPTGRVRPAAGACTTACPWAAPASRSSTARSS